MRLTRRGRIVAGGVIGIFLWATYFGIQALNTLVLSGVIALIVSWIVVRRAEGFRLRRRTVSPAEVGYPRTIEFDVSVPPSLSARIIDRIPDGVRIEDGTNSLRVTGGTATYTAIPEQRGIHRVGPATIEILDPLGLVVSELETTGSNELVTYPEIHSLDGIERGAEALLTGAPTRDRHEFDQLREYQRGDALRDIDWKSSAKRAAEPLVVKEFVAETAAGNAMIVGASEPGQADAMASAAASFACHLLDQGIEVGLLTADEEVPPGSGATQRRAMLTALARTAGGPIDPDQRDAASILIDAHRSGSVTVTMGEGRRSFGELTASESQPVLTDGGSNQ